MIFPKDLRKLQEQSAKEKREKELEKARSFEINFPEEAKKIEEKLLHSALENESYALIEISPIYFQQALDYLNLLGFTAKDASYNDYECNRMPRIHVSWGGIEWH